MSILVDKQAVINAMCEACSDWCDEGVCKKVSAIQKLTSALSDFNMTEKINEAYVSGYEAGYLQAIHDWGNMDE